MAAAQIERSVHGTGDSVTASNSSIKTIIKRISLRARPFADGPLPATRATEGITLVFSGRTVRENHETAVRRFEMKDRGRRPGQVCKNIN